MIYEKLNKEYWQQKPGIGRIRAGGGGGEEFNQLINKLLIKLREMNNKDRGFWWKDAKCLTQSCSYPRRDDTPAALKPGVLF